MAVGQRPPSRIHGKMRPSFAAMKIIEAISSAWGAQKPQTTGPEKITEQSRPNKSELNSPGRQGGGCE